MKVNLLSLFAVAALFTASTRASEEVKYQNDFEKAEVGSVPDDFLVLDGAFAVKEESGNKVLELPGAPLDTFGVLFGPTAKEDIAVSARIFGTGKGRRFPTFAVGVNGIGGYKLRISPGKKQLEIYKGDAVKTSIPFDWQSGKWAMLKIAVVKTGEGKWSVQGKAWQEGSEEPAQPTITFDETETPPGGRQMVSGSPYSGTPILFDDFRVTTLKK